MSYYLGIDPSLACTGLCLLDKKMKVVKYKALSFSASTEYRLRDYYDKLSDFIAVNGVNNIGMEAYAYGKAGQSMAFNIGELGGVYKLAIQRNEVRYIRPLPTEVKKFVTNKPRAEKEEVRKVLNRIYRYSFYDNNQKLFSVLMFFLHVFVHNHLQSFVSLLLLRSQALFCFNFFSFRNFFRIFFNTLFNLFRNLS